MTPIAAIQRPRRPVWAALMALASLLTGCGGEPLVHVPTEKEANEILVELASRGITSADKLPMVENRETVYQIQVASADLNSARQVLLELDLPREHAGGFEQMLGSTGLIPSKTDERARLMYAMAGELERTIQVYDGVVHARVHVVLPERDALARRTDAQPTATAMVLIKHVADDKAVSTTIPTEEEVRTMVARSVEGLQPEDVMVAFTPAVRREVVIPPAPPIWQDTQLQVLAGAAVFGLVAILMSVLLVNEKRRSRRLVAQPA